MNAIEPIARDAKAEAVKWVGFKLKPLADAFEAKKARMIEALTANPTYAIESYSRDMVETQARWDVWESLNAWLKKETLAIVLAEAVDTRDRIIRHGYVPNSTCAFHNAEQAYKCHAAIREWDDAIKALEYCRDGK